MGPPATHKLRSGNSLTTLCTRWRARGKFCTLQSTIGWMFGIHHLSLSRESSGRKQMKLREFVSRWPVLEQLRTRADGTGPEAMSNRSRDLKPKNHGAQVSRSICPYCGVGCGQLVYHKGDRLISIEGDPQSPISRGRLCPKGSDTYELHTHTARLKKVKYRRPF